MSLLIHPDLPPQRELLVAARSAGLEATNHHASGHPWTFTESGQGADIQVQTEHLQVLVLGLSSLTSQDAVTRIAGAQSVDQLDSLAGALPGPTVLVAADANGAVRVQGSTTGTRAVFWATGPDGAAIAADDAGLLARLLGAGVDLDELVVRLSDAEASHPYSSGVIWSGVHLVPPGSWLSLASGSPPRVTRSWTPPDPTDRLDDLAESATAALRTAVADSLAPGHDVSTDLSGGLDSTTIAYMAHELRADLRTVFLRPRDRANTDHLWSTRAATDLGSRHHVLDYADATGMDDDLVARLPEGPAEAARYLALAAVLENALAGERPVVHLNGHGGDELFGAVPAMPWSLIRSRHPHRLRDVLGFQRVNKQYLPATLQLLSRGGTPQRDLRRIAAGEFSSPYDPYSQGSRWVPPVLLPVCLTADARERFRARTLRHANRDDLVLHRDRTSHQIREAVLFHGTLLRRMNLLRHPGSRLTFVAPLLDDRVVRAAMSLDVYDRFTAPLIKPLLARGRPASMPVDFFERRDKGEYSAEAFTGFRAVQNRIRERFADGSTLEDLGLLDPGRFRRLLSRYSPDGETHEQVMRIDLAERWLRSVASAHRPLATAHEEVTG